MPAIRDPNGKTRFVQFDSPDFAEYLRRVLNGEEPTEGVAEWLADPNRTPTGNPEVDTLANTIAATGAVGGEQPDLENFDFDLSLTGAASDPLNELLGMPEDSSTLPAQRFGPTPEAARFLDELSAYPGSQPGPGGRSDVTPGTFENLRRLAHLDPSDQAQAEGYRLRDVTALMAGVGPEDIARIKAMLEAAGLTGPSLDPGDWDPEAQAGFAAVLAFANRNGIQSWRVALSHLADRGMEIRLQAEQEARRAPPPAFTPQQLVEPSYDSIVREIDALVTHRGLSKAEQFELANVWFTANRQAFEQDERLRREAELRRHRAGVSGEDQPTPPPEEVIDPNERLRLAIRERFQPELAIIDEAAENREQVADAGRSLGIFDRMIGTGL